MPKAFVYSDEDFEPTAWHHKLGDIEIDDYLDEDKAEVTDSAGVSHIIPVSELREMKNGGKPEKRYPNTFAEEDDF